MTDYELSDAEREAILAAAQADADANRDGSVNSVDFDNAERMIRAYRAALTARGVEGLPGDGQRPDMCVCGHARQEHWQDAVSILRKRAACEAPDCDCKHFSLRDTEREHEPAETDAREFILADDGTWHMPRESPPVVGDHSVLCVPKSRAIPAERRVEILAKALDQFNRNGQGLGLGAAVLRLREAVEPTLRALGYPKEEK